MQWVSCDSRWTTCYFGFLWRIALNTDERNSICFPKRHRIPQARPSPVTLDGQSIIWNMTVKFLGVRLNAKITFSQPTLHHTSKKLMLHVDSSAASLEGNRLYFPVQGRVKQSRIMQAPFLEEFIPGTGMNSSKDACELFQRLPGQGYQHQKRPRRDNRQSSYTSRNRQHTGA